MNSLVLDVGTTSMRGALFNELGEILSFKSVNTPLLMERGYIEQLPGRYVEGLVNICRTIASEYPVDAVSVTAFRSAITLVDRNCNPLYNFIIWQDTRNQEICERLSHADDEVYRNSGAPINTVFTATKLLWLKENEPELYRKAYKVMTVPDYLICLITGEFVTDRTYGSRTHLMNIHNLQWDSALCKLFSLDEEKLCPLIDQGTVAGTVLEKFSELSGLPSGIPVITAGGDQQCCALGLGVLDDTSLEVNSGTGAFVISLADHPMLGNHSVICNVSALRGKYVVESNVIAGASALNWFVREFFPEHWGERPDYAAIDRLVALTPAGAGGLYCVPHYQGCGSRCWNPGAKAGFWGFTLASTRAEMARSLYEGIAVEIAKSIDALPVSSRTSKRVYAAGGLSKSSTYNQILSDVLGREIIVYSDPQATSIGAFVSAAVALGLYDEHQSALDRVRSHGSVVTFTPDLELADLYQDCKHKTERLYRAQADFISVDGKNVG